MKKMRMLAVLLVLVMACVAVFAACDKGEGPEDGGITVEHTCTYGDWNVTKAATCIERGSMTRTCTDATCNKTETVEIPATGHTYVNGICSVCDYVLDENHTHTYGEWIVSTEPACEEAGVRYKVCACGEQVEEAIAALDHDYGDFVVVAPATCSHIGQKKAECSRCDAFKYEFIDSLPHNYNASGICIECQFDKNGSYTYNTAMSVFPTNWNPHIYQTNTDSTILDYAAIGFYEFDYNDTKDGYKLVPAMASAYPQDVTADYLGQYGIPAHEEDVDDATWRAIRIPLNTNAKFDNGVAITAADYVESLKLLLNPAANNYRADSVYSGNMKIYNAKNYLYQGQTICDPAKDTLGTSITDWSGLYFDPTNVVAFDDIFGTTDMNDLAGYASYFTVDSVNLYAKLMAYCPDGEPVLMTQAIFDDLKALFSANAPLKPYWGWVDTEIGYFTVQKVDYPTMNFEDVGIKADGDAIILFLENELSGFYLNYSLTSSWLVYTPLYKQCETLKDGVYSNTYGTTADTFVGYGPYKLTYFLQDAEIKFKRNEYYFGLKDAEGKDLYATTDINIKYVEQASTRLQMFLKGDLDAYGLTAEDMEDYQSSKYTYYTEGDSTWFMAFNPDKQGLTTAQETANETAPAGTVYNKTIISIPEFRMAFCFGLDRAAYALALDPLGGVAKALYGNMIISDPETGTAYRTTPEAKQAIVNFWGLADQIGTGKTYATIDDAIASIDGYDPVAAKAYLNIAYRIATTPVGESFTEGDKTYNGQGLMGTNDIVKITIGIPRASSKYYSNGATFLKNCFTELAKGTSLEGKLLFENSADLGNDFSDFLKNNSVDMLFGVGWTGSALDPYGLIEAYTSDSYQYDPGWDTTATNLDITIGEDTLRASVDAWTKALNGKEITVTYIGADGAPIMEGETAKINAKFTAGTTVETAIRLKILAAIEQIVLEQYDMIPINLDSSAALKGMQIKYYTEEYIFGVGRGGIKYMTYNNADGAWADYVAANNGSLNYKVSE